MDVFPLYVELSQKELMNELQWVKLTQKINLLNSEQSDVLYALILYHYLLEQKKSKQTSLPYNSKTFDGGRGLLFTITNLPSSLQSIIYHYLTLCC